MVLREFHSKAMVSLVCLSRDVNGSDCLQKEEFGCCELVSKNGPRLSVSSVQAGSAHAGASRFVAECRDQLTRQLPRLLAEVFRRVDDALYDLADKADNNALYSGYVDAMRLLRRRRDEIEGLLLLELGAAVDGFLNGVDTAPAQGAGGPLTVMADAELEESLAVSNLISKSESRYRNELAAIRDHLGQLCGRPALEALEDPLGPHGVCNALRSALRPVAELDRAVKLIVFKLFDKHVMDHLGEIYAQFAARALVSALPRGVAGRAPAVSPEARPIEVSSPGATGRAGAGQRDELKDAAGAAFESIRRLLDHVRRTGGRPQAVPVDTSELFAVLNRLQAPLRAFDSYDSLCQELRQRLVDELRLRDEEGSGRSLGTVDEDTLDLVFLLFEHILHGNDLPDAIKVLIGCLQIPVVKVALLDKSFFNDRAHPARRLLNHVAELAFGWTSEEIASPESVYGRIEQVVDRVVLEFERDLALFEELDAEVVALLETEREAAQIAESAVRRELASRDRDQDARRAILAVIDERLRWYDQVPETVINLLYEGWQEVLLATYERGGMAGEDWRRAIQTVDRLVWSVQPKFDYSERRELLRSIPELLRTLRESLARVSFDPRRLARWIRELQALHMSALRGVGSMPAETASIDAHRRRGAMVRGLPQRDAGPQGPVRAPVGPPAAGAPMAGLLAIGAWIEIRRDDGKLIRVKLSWRSGRCDTYFFVDRRGRKVLELTGGDLAELLAQGAAKRLGNEMPIVDHALESVLRELKAQ
jgi:hypothetical protein